jgi:hypothetical protein
MPAFSADHLTLLDGQEELVIETGVARGAPARRTTIWVVVEGGQVFVRSVRGPSGRWYRDLLSDPAGVVHVDREALPVLAVQAADPASVERCSSALRSKYATDPALHSMLRPETLSTTMRLEPR